MNGGMVEVIASKGCSRLFVGASTSIASISSGQSSEFTFPSSSSLLGPVHDKMGPFAGLVICVTGLSKEARLQVMASTTRLGGQYSSSLHPRCTHLVVKSLVGRKFEHALKHGQKNGLFVVTFGWFVDSVRRNVRLDESLYKVGENGFPLVESDGGFMVPRSGKSCLPASYVEDGKPLDVRNKTWQLLGEAQKEYSDGLIFSKDYIYIDPDLSAELKKKVAVAAGKEGATILDHCFIGSPASHIVCENPSFQKYVGRANTLVTPLWVLKSVKEKRLQRLMHLSSDLVRQMAMILESVQVDQTLQDGSPGIVCPAVLHSRNGHTYGMKKDTIEERQRNTEIAKQGVRDRRSRRMQSCNIPLHPINPSSLLESLCWSVSEPTSSTHIYMEPLETEDASSVFYNARGDERDLEVSVEAFSRPLKESEKREVVFKGHFLTILFPIDRFGELGPSSRTFFSDCGFTCLQILDNIYNFYQENMSSNEVEVAIHTDSRHADRLRSVYASKESLEQGYVQFRRIDFLGCRRFFEALRRIGGEHNSNCYELLLRA